MPDFVLKSIEETCSACPSQWTAITEDGRELYIRYRFGCLTVSIVRSTNHKEIYRQQVGDSLDGYMSQEEMMEHTGMTIAQPKKRCPSCGDEVNAEWKHCTGCGERQ